MRTNCLKMLVPIRPVDSQVNQIVLVRGCGRLLPFRKRYFRNEFGPVFGRFGVFLAPLTAFRWWFSAVGGGHTSLSGVLRCGSPTAIGVRRSFAIVPCLVCRMFNVMLQLATSADCASATSTCPSLGLPATRQTCRFVNVVASLIPALCSLQD